VRQPTDHVYYSATRSLCKTCKRSVDAKIQFRGDAVWFDKFCPEHGAEQVLVASSVEWYLDALSFVAPSEPPSETQPVRRGCPFDCGPCASHQQKVVMPVVPVTSACNLDCPICYTVNKNEGAYITSDEEFASMLAHLKRQHAELDIINFTGGEPTMHPKLPHLLSMARAAGIRRLTVSTNGLKLKNEDYVRELAAVDARIVLSLDTFDPEVDQKMLGANTVRTKLGVLDLLAKHDVTTTLLPAVAAGLNDKDLPKLFDLVMSRPNLVSLEIHTLTFTGQGGVGFDRTARITTPDIHEILKKHTGGVIAPRDFVPSPLAHPHCYSICYLLCVDGGGYVPLTRLIGREKMFALLEPSLYMQPRAEVEEALRTAMDELWADPDKLPNGEAVLATLRRLLDEMFPTSGAIPLDVRQKIAERSTKAIYIHSHMDEESFDMARIMKCSIGVPDAQGGNIPTCSYNVLYRERDKNFADPEMLARMGRGAPHPIMDAPVEGRRSLKVIS
jgi:uncharacterized radical SAM superfamily Fe-S cluster-containing enzyme